MATIKFRNYTPQTQLLEGTYALERSQPESIKPLIEDKLELLQDETLRDSNNGQPFRVDPKVLKLKRVDWDLKRRIEKRMEKLDKETRKAIDKHIKDNRNKVK